MKNLFLVFAFVIFLGQSCTVYQKTTISLEQSIDKGKVQVVTTEGREVKFKNIVSTNNVYFGVVSNEDGNANVQLSSGSIESIYLQDKTKSLVFSVLLISPIVALLIYSMANSERIF